MSDRKPLMAGNWKMHLTHLEAIQAVQKLSYALDEKDYKQVEVAVCPPFTSLRSVQTVLDADRIPIALGAQNCHWEPQGAFTGEISAPMLAKLNVDYVIVGHSERREIFGETDEMVAKKLRAVLGAGMDPDPVRRRNARRTRGGRHRREGRDPSAGRAPRSEGATISDVAWSPTNRSGQSAPARTRPLTTRTRQSRRFGAVSGRLRQI